MTARELLAHLHSRHVEVTTGSTIDGSPVLLWRALPGVVSEEDLRALAEHKADLLAILEKTRRERVAQVRDLTREELRRSGDAPEASTSCLVHLPGVKQRKEHCLACGVPSYESAWCAACNAAMRVVGEELEAEKGNGSGAPC